MSERLYQDYDKLPVILKTSHFEEGLLYTMTLQDERKKPMLVMITKKKDCTFFIGVFLSVDRGGKLFMMEQMMSNANT